MDENEFFSKLEKARLNRRQLLQGIGVTAAGTFSLAAFLEACATGVKNATTAKRGGQLILDVQTEPNTFSPLESNTAGYYWIDLQVAEPLYTYDDNLKIVPLLAVGAPQSTDGLSWTVKLKSGVTFHNGDPFTAEHVVATIGSILTRTLSTWRSRFVGIDKYEAIDAQTVHVSFKTANYLFPQTLALVPMLHKDHLPENDKIMGTGPFSWTEHRQGDHLLLTTNAHYHATKPLVDSLLIRFVPDPSTRLVNLLQGTSHIMLLPQFADLPTLSKNSNVHVINVPAPVYMPTYINTKKPLFADIRMRQALGYAMDRSRVRDIVYGGQADIAQGPVAPVLRGFDPSVKIWGAAADVNKAKALLDAVGYTAKPTDFTVSVYNVPASNQAFQVIQQDWQKAGLKVNIELLDLAGWVRKFLSRTFDIIVSYEFDGTNWGDVGWSPLAPYRTGDPANYTGFSDPAFDSLMKQSQETPDTKKQDDLWAQAYKIVSEAAVNLVPVYPRMTGAYRKNISGVRTNPLKLTFLRLDQVSIG